MNALLSVRGLGKTFATSKGPVVAVDDVGGPTVAIVVDAVTADLREPPDQCLPGRCPAW